LNHIGNGITDRLDAMLDSRLGDLEESLENVGQASELMERLESLSRSILESGVAVRPSYNDWGRLERLEISGNVAAIVGKKLKPFDTQSRRVSSPSLYQLDRVPKGVSFSLAAAPFFSYYNYAKKIDIVGDWNKNFRKFADEVIDSKTSYLLHDRFYTLWQSVGNVAKIKAPIIEIGVWKGGSSRFLAEAQRYFGKTGKIYSCDTFVGHTQITPALDGEHQVGDFATADFEDVKKLLSPYPEVEILRGDIQDTASKIGSDAIAMMHLDVDVYGPTKFALEHFAPRIEPGGAIIVDDYGFTTCPGVKHAVDEFVAENAGFQKFHLLTGQAILVRAVARPTLGSAAKDTESESSGRSQTAREPESKFA
jgi:predicted O-methyltransferase YrrM